MQNNQADMVRLLLNYGADPTALDGNGDRPLSLGTPKNTKSAFNDALFSAIAQHEYVKQYCLFVSQLYISLISVE